MIALATVFSLVSVEIIGSQQSGTFSQVQGGMASQIVETVDRINGIEGASQVTYEPPVDLYTLSFDEEGMRLEVDGGSTTQIDITSAEISETTIEDADALCITKDEEITVEQGRCSPVDVSEICSGGGCNPGICQPDLGEDCTNSACTYPENAENPDASEYCDPDYTGDEVAKPDPTVGIGWVNQSHVNVKNEGETCSRDFQCGTTSSGENLKCNPLHSTASSSGPNRCCPEGEKWDGSQCKEEEDKVKLVFVPLNQNTGLYDSGVSTQSDFFKEVYPISSDNVEIVKMSNVCEVPVKSDYSTCTESNRTQTLSEVENCAVNSGYGDADHYVGMFQTDVCNFPDTAPEFPNMEGKNPAGWSIPDTPSVVAEANHKIVTAHEIGHNYGLNDEYVDACRYDIGRVDPKNSNCLKQSLEGDDGVQSESKDNIGHNSPFCAGGSQTPDSYSFYCLGNKNSEGGRAIMSSAGLADPRKFSEPSINYLNSLGDFS
jgi:hypothetical protein